MVGCEDTAVLGGCEGLAVLVGCEDPTGLGGCEAPGALGGVLVEELGAASEDKASAMDDGEAWEGGCAVSVEC